MGAKPQLVPIRIDRNLSVMGQVGGSAKMAVCDSKRFLGKLQAADRPSALCLDLVYDLLAELYLF